MKRALGTAIAALSIMTAGAACAQNPAQGAWAGEYRYDWSGGRTTGGSGIAVTYALRVGAGVTDCALDVTGYQSDEHILCEVAANADTLWIRFRSYADGRLVNQYGTAVYRPGQDLFRLRRTGRRAPETEWQSMSPDAAKGRPALRFRKV